MRTFIVAGLTLLSLILYHPTSALQAHQIDLDVSAAQTTLLAGQKQVTHIKIGLTGFKLASEGDRSPINVCLVLDKSGSMSGEKIVRAKAAAIDALQRLDANDIVSVVTYDSTVSVVVPATKLTDREAVVQKLREIEAGGSTALFAGVSKGAEELRKFLNKERVNRVILLSDGLANVGPQSPSELGELGESLSKEGISVTTIGLGLDYNEDLMTQLASRSDGNHVFVEKSTELADIFNREFSDVLSVVAQEVAIHVRCSEGVRPVRVLNHEADIVGQDVWIKLNQLYSEQEKYIILEVEIPAQKASSSLDLAAIDVSYMNMKTKVTDRLSTSVRVFFSDLLADVKKSINKPVMEACVLQLANLRSQEATVLRDRGDIEGSRRLLLYNAKYLQENAVALDSLQLQERSRDNRNLSQMLNAEDWKRGRKLIRFQQYSDANQQRSP